MTQITPDIERVIDDLVEAARLLGGTQAKKGFGAYTDEDAMLERAWRESIAKCRASLCAALAAGQPQPVGGWRLVPVEPTEAMLRTIPSYERSSTVGIAVYRAMLAAAPPPAASEPSEAEVEAACAAFLSATPYNAPMSAMWMRAALRAAANVRSRTL